MKGTPKPLPLRWRVKRRLKTLGIIVVAFGVGFLFNYSIDEVQGNRASVDLREIANMERSTEPLIVGLDDSSEFGNSVISTTPEALFRVLEAYPHLPYPEYMPSGFLFQSLTVDDIKTQDWIAKYIFINVEGDEIYISINNREQDRVRDVVMIYNPEDYVAGEDFIISYQEEPLEENCVLLKKWITGQAISISAPFDKTELEQILDGLEYDIV